MSSVRYQGYPYVNPTVIDAPTLDPVTAAKWTNLPRRPIGTSIPGPSGSGVTSGIGSSGETSEASASSSVPIPPKKDIDENPVVYIELPQADGSDVCQSIESEEREPEYVQDTILYDPFENRRIVPKEEEAASESSASDTHSVGASSMHAPNRPNTLDLMSPGPSSSQSPIANTSGLPSFMEKESLVYGGHGADSFPMSPIPMSEFPEPPPAYTEIAMTPVQSPTPQPPVLQTSIQQTQPVMQQAPPRTEVIVQQTNPIPPMPPMGLMNYDRKFLTCHHCGARVHTLVIKENGHVTYIIAFLLFLFIMPFFVIVYFTDCFKHKNHYCPNCNNLIGYQLPIIGHKVNYVT